MKSNKEYLDILLSYIDNIEHVDPNDIPPIDLYMDQVTAFLDEHLASTRQVGEDKILTKTMINNYAKNHLLPAPIKKKYSKNHIIMLILIYYYKNVISLKDIEVLLDPISSNHFSRNSKPELTEIYNELLSLEVNGREELRKDIIEKFNIAADSFKSTKSKDKDYLQLLSFISELSFEIYIKKQLVEILAEELRKDLK